MGSDFKLRAKQIDQASIVNGRRSESKEVSRSGELIRFGILVIGQKSDRSELVATLAAGTLTGRRGTECMSRH